MCVRPRPLPPPTSRHTGCAHRCRNAPRQIFVDGLVNFLSWYGLCLSLRTTLPILNGFLLPEAPVFVRERVYPFLVFMSEPFMMLFRTIAPMSINGFDLAVFPAFAGVLFLIAAADAVGADLSVASRFVGANICTHTHTHTHLIHTCVCVCVCVCIMYHKILQSLSHIFAYMYV